MTESERCKRYRARLKAQLIAQLGGKCAECGSTEKLEFDHPFGRKWRARDKWASTRLKIYAEEAAKGLVRVLCRSCNASLGAYVGDPVDDGQGGSW